MIKHGKDIFNEKDMQKKTTATNTKCVDPNTMKKCESLLSENGTFVISFKCVLGTIHAIVQLK